MRTALNSNAEHSPITGFCVFVERHLQYGDTRCPRLLFGLLHHLGGAVGHFPTCGLLGAELQQLR